MDGLEIKSFSALGHALAAARDARVLSANEFAVTAGELSAALVTGVIEFGAYMRVHKALGKVVEAAFAGKHMEGFGVVVDSETSLESHLGVVSRLWEHVERGDPEVMKVVKLFGSSFDFKTAKFGGGSLFSAKLVVAPKKFIEKLRLTSILVYGYSGELHYDMRRVALCDADSTCGKTGMLLGWGERRIFLEFS